jgi:DNA-binding NarL/FixJ family response regulator
MGAESCILVAGSSRLHAELMCAALPSCHASTTSLTDAAANAANIDIVIYHAVEFETCLATLSYIRRQLPGPAVIVVGGAFDEVQWLSLIELGAVSSIPEDSATHVLLETIGAVRRREAGISHRIIPMAFARLAHLGRLNEIEESTDLTNREAQVFQLVQQGLSNKEIAQLLTLSLSTVKNHVHQILAKLRIRSRRDAIDWQACMAEQPATARPESQVDKLIT